MSTSSKMFAGAIAAMKLSKECFTVKPEGPHICGFDCADMSKDSMAIIASDGEHAHVIDYVGGHLEYWQDMGPSLSEEFEGTEIGVWLWTGRIASYVDYHGEHDEELAGEFRKLTPEEWDLLSGGDTLWNGDEWRCCKDVEPAPTETLETIEERIKAWRTCSPEDEVDTHIDLLCEAEDELRALRAELAAR